MARRKGRPVERHAATKGLKVQVHFPLVMARQLNRLASEETEGRVATIARKLVREALAARAAQ